MENLKAIFLKVSNIDPQKKCPCIPGYCRALRTQHPTNYPKTVKRRETLEFNFVTPLKTSVTQKLSSDLTKAYLVNSGI